MLASDTAVRAPGATGAAPPGQTLRRADRALDDSVALAAILERAPIGHLGLSQDGHPYVVPLNFVYHDGTILFHSAPEGKKIAYLQANPAVCFVVEEHYGTIHSNRARPHSSHYASVMAFGRARLAGEHEIDLRMATMQALLDKYAPGRYYHPLQPRELAGTTVVQITVDALTGKVRAPFYPNDRVQIGRHVLAGGPADLLLGCSLAPDATARVEHVDAAGWVHLAGHAAPVRWELLESVKGPV